MASKRISRRVYTYVIFDIVALIIDFKLNIVGYRKNI